MQLKEIKPKEYMRGTKAVRLRMYILVGLVGFTALACVPLCYLKRHGLESRAREKMKQREEADHTKFQEIYKISEGMMEKKN